MKNIFGPNSKKRDFKVFGIELLSENEMLNVKLDVMKLLQFAYKKC